MKVRSVTANNRRRVFEVTTARGHYAFPYARAGAAGGVRERVVSVFPDPEAGGEAFTYRLASGAEDSVHLDAVLEYNEDPEVLLHLLLHRLTVEANRAFQESGLSKRELVRRLGTSASQLYRLLDPTHRRKSVESMLTLLRVLGRDVDVVVSPRSAEHASRDRPMTRRPSVPKNLRLSQAKIDRARRVMGTRTDAETIEEALDLVGFHEEAAGGIARIAGAGALVDALEQEPGG